MVIDTILSILNGITKEQQEKMQFLEKKWIEKQ